MNPLEVRLAELEARVAKYEKSDRFVFEKLLQIMDGRNIQLGTTTGTRIGTATTQKLAFFNAAPVARQATISDPSGGVTQDAEARAAINTLIDRLQAYGLIA
jgi:hypothetical protein